MEPEQQPTKEPEIDDRISTKEVRGYMFNTQVNDRLLFRGLLGHIGGEYGPTICKMVQWKYSDKLTYFFVVFSYFLWPPPQRVSLFRHHPKIHWSYFFSKRSLRHVLVHDYSGYFDRTPFLPVVSSASTCPPAVLLIGEVVLVPVVITKMPWTNDSTHHPLQLLALVNGVLMMLLVENIVSWNIEVGQTAPSSRTVSIFNRDIVYSSGERFDASLLAARCSASGMASWR